MLATYTTKATYYEKYCMVVPEDFNEWSKEKQLDYIMVHDPCEGDFVETTDIMDRTFTKDIEVSE